MRFLAPHPHRPRRRHPFAARGLRSDAGQTALIMVIAIAVLLTIVGGTMVSTIVNNAPILTNASIQRYAYRALASGLNVYQSAINADPYLAACNWDTNYPGGADANSQCAGLSYETWSEVPGTNVGNGVIPEYYMFDNPQQIKNSTTDAISYLEVQIVGAAGFPGKNVFYSTIAKFTPSNDFLNNVWWSNFESFDSNAGGSARDCNYYYAPSPGPNRGIISTSGGNAFIVPTTPCTAVDFETGDNLLGPVYSNDSLYIDGTPNFTGTVNTADPECLFVDYTQSGCASDPNYTTTGSGFGHAVEPLPTDDSELAAVAKQGGCYYVGPTTVTLSVTQVSGVNVGQMDVVSRDTTGYPGSDTMNESSTDSSTCPTDGTADLPLNGVLYVNEATGTPAASVNPFYSTTDTSQVESACANCYYGQTPSPGTEADAFVNGSLSGHLTIAAYNNVIVDGAITYADCSGKWGTSGTSTPSESQCQYNSATSTSGINDTLGLIANNFVEINRPVYNDNTSTTLPTCNGGWVPPLCDPSTSTGAAAGGQGLTVDATVLALNQSFAVNNYSVGGNEGTLNIYGSIQQDARGAVGQSGGYVKYYYYDPRLTLYGPPYYLTPGTPSWSLQSSSESYTGIEPSCPPPQSMPVTAAPSWPISGSTAAGTAPCLSAS